MSVKIHICTHTHTHHTHIHTNTHTHTTHTHTHKHTHNTHTYTQTHTHTHNTHTQRIQCFPGKMGLLESISAKMQPTDQMSTVGRVSVPLHTLGVQIIDNSLDFV